MQNLSMILPSVMVAFIAFAVETDIYVPSLPDMAIYFGVGPDVIQTVLSVNFFAIFAGCMLFGPYSDRFGRRKLLLSGMVVFTLASVVCALATDFSVLLVARFFQGAGAASIVSMGMTVIFDAFGQAAGTAKLAMLNAICTAAMAFAPLVGSRCNIYFDWRAAFWVIVLMAGAGTWLLYRYVPETLPPEKRLKKLSLLDVAKGYIGLLTNPWYLFNTLLWNIMLGCLIVYIANISIIFMNNLGVPEDIFGYYQTSTMLAFCIASLAASRYAAFFGVSRGPWIGGCMYFGGTLALVAVGLLNPGSPFWISAAMALASAGLAIACVPFFGESLQTVGNLAGFGVALAQSLRMLVLAGMTELSRITFDGSIMGVIYVLAPFTLLCGVLLIVREHYRPRAALATHGQAMVH